MGSSLLDAIGSRLTDAGIGPVVPSLSDGRALSEAVMLSFGVPERTTIDYSGSIREVLRVSVVVKRLSEARAMEDAALAQHALRRASLEPADGSFDLEKVEMDAPQPLPWDESGRWVWAFDIRVTTTRKDFF